MIVNALHKAIMIVSDDTIVSITYDRHLQSQQRYNTSHSGSVV